MRIVEKNKHRRIEKDTMELAMSWYHRYIEKEGQIEKIEQGLIEFENWLHSQDGEVISVAEMQKAWAKTINV